MSNPDRIDLAAARERLRAERDELRALSHSNAEARRPVTLDQQSVGRLSRMDALQAQAMALESERRRRLRLQQLEAALRRMEEDEYGYCVRCGEAIAPERLSLDPAVPTCRDCAEGAGR